MASKLIMGEFEYGNQVIKEGYGYYGVVLRMERQARTRYVIVQWEGSRYARREYPHNLTRAHERPARVTPYS